jgi:hypothetical protein
MGYGEKTVAPPQSWLIQQISSGGIRIFDEEGIGVKYYKYTALESRPGFTELYFRK